MQLLDHQVAIAFYYVNDSDGFSLFEPVYVAITIIQACLSAVVGTSSSLVFYKANAMMG